MSALSKVKIKATPVYPGLGLERRKQEREKGGTGGWLLWERHVQVNKLELCRGLERGFFSKGRGKSQTAESQGQVKAAEQMRTALRLEILQ